MTRIAAMSPPASEPSKLLRSRVPLYLVAGRIVFVTGLSFAVAITIFLLLGGYWLWATVAAVCALPFLALMFVIERVPGGG